MNSDFSSLFSGLDKLIKTKSVIGEPMKIDGATIVPIMEVSIGMASGAFNNGSSDAGAMCAKMVPTSLFVMHDGTCRIIQIKDTDAISKAIDLIPEFINKIAGKGDDTEIIEKAKKAVEYEDK